MHIDFTGRQIAITPEVREYIQKHLRKLTRLLGDRLAIHVILTAEKHRRTAELALDFRAHTLVGAAETTDALTAINGALDKLERQAVRLVERRRTRRRRAKAGSARLALAL